jgi:TRAP-type uncharacterized transport system substrate-binding protein
LVGRQHYGLKARDFKSTPGSWTEGTKLFASGEADAIFRVLPPGIDLVSYLLQNTRAKLVPIDQAAAMKIKLPYLEANLIPKGTYLQGRSSSTRYGFAYRWGGGYSIGSSGCRAGNS